MLFGGLTGARTNTMYAMFIAVGMIHFFVRPISKKIVLVGLVALFVFAYSYALFYKKGGIQNLENVWSGADHHQRLAGGLAESMVWYGLAAC